MTPVHVTNSFEFVVRAPLETAAALFAPEAERAWCDDWDPEFVWPQPAADVLGAVWTLQRGTEKWLWINTCFDLKRGCMQYVVLVPETLVSTIDVRLTPVDLAATAVHVTYSRTALNGAANTRVEALGESDRGQGPHWQSAIERHLDH